MLKKLNSNVRGFTLIELLIVIVIIGILAGVLISVIDPSAQQNRARDANVRATMNKIALATNGYISAYGRIPNEVEMLGGLSNTQASTFNDCLSTANSANAANCRFQMANMILADTCNGQGYMGHVDPNGNQCYFRYCGGDATTAGAACTFTTSQPNPTSDYRLSAKAFGSPNVFLYRSATSTMYLCDANGSACTAP